MALPSKETAVVRLGDAAALAAVAEEVEDADLEVDMAVVVTEEEAVVVVAEEATTATSVVSPVTWRESVPKAVEDTAEVAVATEEVVATVETEVEVDTEEEAVEVAAAAVEAVTAAVSLDISPGIAAAVDVEVNTVPAVGKGESVVSHMIVSSSRRLLSFYYPLFSYYDGSLSLLVCFQVFS